MTAKQYLQEYRRCKVRIRKLREQIRELNDLMDGLNSPQMDGDRVQSSHNPDAIGENVAKKSDLVEALELEIFVAIEVMNKIEGTIDRIQNVDYQMVLQKRYIGLETWEDIAEEMHYSGRWVLVLHGRALQEVEKLIHE